jgi:pyruvate formate lyase activating enzyme
MLRESKCIACGRCVEACPLDAVMIDPTLGVSVIDRKKCNRCFACVEACPTKAMVEVGKYMTAEEALAEAARDELFYFRSGGGITISGGEPLFQPAFTYSLLKSCHERGYHTALDTSGYAQGPVFEKILQHVNLVLFDIKHLGPRQHRDAVGKSNQLILRNLHTIPREIKVWLRVPLIPRYNDSLENLERVGQLAAEINAERISLLPFNRFGEGKYRRIGKKYNYGDVRDIDEETIQEAKNMLEYFGVTVTIGE